MSLRQWLFHEINTRSEEETDLSHRSLILLASMLRQWFIRWKLDTYGPIGLLNTCNLCLTDSNGLAVINQVGQKLVHAIVGRASVRSSSVKNKVFTSYME